eukprot:12747652-Ditylum_brightwellii.AAC.1
MNDWNGSRGCGYYGMLQNSSSLVFKHAIDISTTTGSMKTSDFSSLKFSQLYLTGDIPETAMNMQFALDECIELINDNGGFTVVR